MKSIRNLAACIVLLAASFGAPLPADALQGQADKTLSPYFFVKSDDPEVDCLPLQRTRADVDIAGVIADVKVTQVYKNQGQKPLEAIYVFPASTRAAVYAMRMTIGERTIEAEVKERGQARRDYEQARDNGQSASLLEQQRPNVFQMNVANILPGDVIKVELNYTELLVPTSGIYEFVYPTVVGPRYSEKKAGSTPDSEHWLENPYLHQGEKAPYGFDIDVSLNGGVPIQKITCSTHQVDVSYRGKARALVDLADSEKQGGNRDFILKYRLSGNQVQSGLLLHEGEKENFFLLMAQPPKRVTPEHIPAREYIFIVDVSGSMYGFPLDISKKLLKNLIGNLRPSDTFNILLFAGGSTVMAERSLPATAGNIRKAFDIIDRQQGGGSTRLLPALKRSLALPRTEGCSRSIVIVTDGYVAVEEEAFDLIRNRLGEANMFAFGIGSSVNRHLIEGMARVGMGEPFVITKPEEAEARAEAFRKIIQSPVLANISIDFGKFDVYNVEPPSVPDVLAERPVIVFGKWRGKPRGTITIEGVTGKRKYHKKIRVADSKQSKDNKALKYLWARHRIAVLGDYNKLNKNDKRVKEITRLGLDYNLLTAYTSFVAIDKQIRVKNGKAVTVKQPLPLPQGVSDYAVGAEMQKSAFRYSQPPGAPPVGRLFSKLRETEEVDAVKDEGAPEPAVFGPVCTIENISVTGTLSKGAIEKALLAHLSHLSQCLHTAPVPPAGTPFTVELKLDSSGQVVKVTFVKGKKILSKKHRECLTVVLKKISFPAPSDNKPARITLTLSL